MVGGLQYVVIHVKCDPNQLNGYDAVGVENGPSPLLWPVAYTTACTTVQAVMIILLCVSDSVLSDTYTVFQKTSLFNFFE